LRDLGVTDISIANAIHAGHLHPIFRGVFGVGTPRPGIKSRLLAAVLACGQGTVVSHRAAAVLLGLHERAPVVIDVIAPAESGRGINGIQPHQVAPPRGAEAGVCDGIPCTSPSRTIVDLAGMLGERPLRRVIEQAAVLRVLEALEIERILATSRRRGSPILRAILEDWRPADSAEVQTGTERLPHLRSGLEARLLALIVASDLPVPICNRTIRSEDEDIEVDFVWPEQRLVVETDGKRFHDHPLAFERDRKRDRALSLGGYRTVRFTQAQITQEPAAVISAIHRLLAADFG
jgi:hypothetical protein